MANSKQRYINTRIWNDTYVSCLDPVEKLLFIYALTNGHTNIAGIYEIPLKIVAVETGLDISMLEKILPRLEEKINYVDGHMIIKNHLKHQEMTSINVVKGISNCLEELNQDFLNDVVNKGLYIIPREVLHTLSIPLDKVLNYSNSNLDSNSTSDEVAKPLKASKVKSKKILSEVKPSQATLMILKKFEAIDQKNKTYTNNKTQREACEFLSKNYGLENILAIIEQVLPLTNTKPRYEFPHISTPKQLMENWAKIKDGIQTKKVEVKKDTVLF